MHDLDSWIGHGRRRSRKNYSTEDRCIYINDVRMQLKSKPMIVVEVRRKESNTGALRT